MPIEFLEFDETSMYSRFATIQILVESYFDGFKRVIDQSKYQDRLWVEKWTRYIAKVREESFMGELPFEESKKKAHIFKSMLRLKILQWNMCRVDLENNFDLNAFKEIQLN